MARASWGLTGLLAIFSAIPALAQADPQMVKAAEPYARCMAREIAASDDGRSDASTIARAVSWKCDFEFREIARLSTAEMTDNQRKIFVGWMVEDRKDWDVNYVLAYRAALRPRR